MDRDTEREAISRVYLSGFSRVEIMGFELEVLESCACGPRLDARRRDELHMVVQSLLDCGYLRSGFTRDLKETLGITRTGRPYMEWLRDTLRGTGRRLWRGRTSREGPRGPPGGQAGG